MAAGWRGKPQTNAVRQFKTANPQRNITVYLRNGVYRLQQTIVFSLQDSGNPGQTITYAAYPGGKPVLCADVPIRNWRKLTSFPDYLPRQARGNVWVADVSFLRKIKERQQLSPTVATQMKRSQLFYTLYDGESRLPRPLCPAPTNYRPEKELLIPM